MSLSAKRSIGDWRWAGPSWRHSVCFWEAIGGCSWKCWQWRVQQHNWPPGLLHKNGLSSGTKSILVTRVEKASEYHFAKVRIYTRDSNKLSSPELFSTDFAPKVTDQPFGDWFSWGLNLDSCTAASNLKNASSLCSSKFNPIKISS